jgi:hypothetical protein
MSAYFQQYQHYSQQHFHIDPHAFEYDQYGTRRSKTPTDSLLNHDGHSPCPLTTTPPLSRNTSHPPEAFHNQPFEQMVCDSGSLSNSPTSVRTPDGESFEVTLDSESMRNFYHQNGNAMSTQGSQNAIPATDSSMFFTAHGTFTDQGIQFGSPLGLPC